MNIQLRNKDEQRRLRLSYNTTFKHVSFTLYLNRYFRLQRDLLIHHAPNRWDLKRFTYAMKNKNNHPMHDMYQSMPIMFTGYAQ